MVLVLVLGLAFANLAFSNEHKPVARNPEDIRREYGSASLSRSDLEADPLAQFGIWFDAANAAGLVDATAMTLATVTEAGLPQARIVLLKGYDDRGYVWYTDYASDKGRELAANPRASLLFYWRELERQVRISGSVAKISAEESAAYFHSRPLDSRLSAAVSEQSRVVGDRRELEDRVAELNARYPNGDIPAPANWGGYRLSAERYEFWQGRTGRLHDRFCYLPDGDDWIIERLQP